MAFTWSYSGTNGSHSWSITINTATTLTGSGYLATSATGTIFGATITGLVAVGGLTGTSLTGHAANDNLLFASDTVTPSLDSGGLAFTLSDGTYAGLASSSNVFLGSYNASKSNTFTVNITSATTYTPGIACFLQGTYIRTTMGEILVQNLRAGDCVITASGATAPIVWIGCRTLDIAEPAHHPVRLRTGSVGPGLPVRDLFLSPEHAVFTDGVLVPAKHLLNGGSIARVAVDEIIYFHVLLGRHDVILSEGLPTESFLDDDNIAEFDNAGEAPGVAPYMEPCAPRITQGVRLEAIRSRLESMSRVTVPA